MKQDNILLVIAVIAVIVSLTGMYVVQSSTSTLESLLTGQVIKGKATESPSINIISAGGRIGSKTIDWGAGSTNIDKKSATLITNGTTEASNTWRVIDEGLIIENIGNKDIILFIHANKSARDFISGDNPSFQYKVSNIESESCQFNANSDTYQELTTNPQKICQIFHKSSESNKIKIDFQLKVSTNSKMGTLTNPIIFTYETI